MDQMKIINIKLFYFYPNTAKNLLLCRIETDNGLYGWGEAYVVLGKEKSVEQYLIGIGEHLVGRDPFAIRHTVAAMYNDFAARRGSADFFSAISAVEMALWDIVGKYVGQPVYNLLGGPSRERVRVYANGWYDVSFGDDDSPDGMARRAIRVKKMGFTAMKFDPFMRSPWRNVITKQEEDAAVVMVRTIRDAVGPNVDLLIEMHRRLSPFYAIRFADRIVQYNPYWYEEPCIAENISLLKQVKDAISFPVVAGETMYNRYEYLSLFESNAVNIINPDVCSCCGITGLLDIATMAEPHHILVSPHNYNSTTVALAATVHVSAVISNFLIAETFVNLKQVCDDVVKQPIIIDNGFIDLPKSPGLGIDFDLDRLNLYPYQKVKKQFPVKSVAQYQDEFPKKDDFIYVE